MKARKYLEQIKNMDAKINADIEELAQIEALATKTTAIIGGEKVQNSSNQEKMADSVVKLLEMKEQINREIDELIDFKNHAKTFLYKCEADCITLLYKRYFLHKRWEVIAVEMSFTYQWVSGGLHKKALAQFQKGLDEYEFNA